MTVFEIILLVICVILSGCIIWLAKTLYNTGVLILSVQDVLEDSLDIIDSRIESIEEILTIPLFSDSPEIKRLQNDMITCKEAIDEIAYALSNSMSKEPESRRGQQA